MSQAAIEPRRVPQPVRPSGTRNPRDTTAERWYVVSDLDVAWPTVDPGSPTARECLARAAALSVEARALSKRRDMEAAASLHLLAAELRREAGAWASCAENYRALVHHHLRCQDLTRAATYARKLLFVTERSSDQKERLEACLLAAAVFVEARLVASAAGAAAKAAKVVASFPDPKSRARLAALFERIGQLAVVPPAPVTGPGCDCGEARGCIVCHEGDDGIPDEFQVQIPRMPLDRHGSPRNSWGSAELSGIEAMMELPGPAGECRNWVGVSVEGGRYRIVMVPNRSARAMRAAREILEAARAAPKGTGFPPATVIQVVCALDAFINAVGFFLARSGGESWGSAIPPYVRKPDRSRFEHKPLQTRWSVVGQGMFGPQWEAERLESLGKLTELRNSLVHSRGEAERIALPLEPPIGMLVGLDAVAKPWAAPQPWADRIVTPALAEWSIGLGEGLIAAFRNSWHAECREEVRASLMSDAEARRILAGR
ncbi:hypothetical protein [Methylobacterium radiodurans]|uniref:hypothetical protein n=1 Tax=Methylobacterium radiodurans TaxID=2202828 RepID=UPI0013A590F8|nr:hypothetical protein [Methylobacterium radiodurans]